MSCRLQRLNTSIKLRIQIRNAEQRNRPDFFEQAIGEDTDRKCGKIPSIQYSSGYHRDLIAMTIRAMISAKVFAVSEAMRIGCCHLHATTGTALILFEQQRFAAKWKETELYIMDFKYILNTRYTHSIFSCLVKITCALGGAQSRVPRVNGTLYGSSGLTAQLPGIGNNSCFVSCSDTSQSRSHDRGICLSLNFDIKLNATLSADQFSIAFPPHSA